MKSNAVELMFVPIGTNYWLFGSSTEARLRSYENSKKHFVGESFRPDTWDMGEEANAVLPRDERVVEAAWIKSTSSADTKIPAVRVFFISIETKSK